MADFKQDTKSIFVKQTPLNSLSVGQLSAKLKTWIKIETFDINFKDDNYTTSLLSIGLQVSSNDTVSICKKIAFNFNFGKLLKI